MLGAGKIGEALIAGLLSSEWRAPGDIVATGRRTERLTELHERYGVRTTLSNPDAAARAALVVIAVKPQDIDQLLTEVAGIVEPEQTVLSIAAAIPTSRKGRSSSHTTGYSTSAASASGQHNTSRMQKRRNFTIGSPRDTRPAPSFMIHYE